MLATVDVHFAAMGLLEQIVDVLGYDIDDFDLQRFFLRDRYAFPYRLNRPLGITAALLRDALGERGSEVFDLLILSRMKSSTAGLMVPSIEIRSTWGVEASFDCANTDAPATSNERQK